MKRDVIKLFEITRKLKDFEKVYNALKELEPVNLNLDDIIAMVHYIEAHAKDFSKEYKHYSIFGTGGDALKTINISTISAIMAALIDLPIIKVGTRHITSTWGSEEFMRALLLNGNNTFTDKILRDAKVFRYYPLKHFSSEYSEVLANARKRINDEKYMDIYKIIYPISNLTNSLGQVNGISSLRYLSYFINICLRLNRRAIFVHSKFGVDEIFSGENIVVEVVNNKIKEYYVRLDYNSRKYFTFMNESQNVDQHISKFHKIITGNCPHGVLETIAYNVAVIYKLSEPNKNIKEIYKLIISAFKKMTKKYRECLDYIERPMLY